MIDDPAFYQHSQNQTCLPLRPLSITGFVVDPTARTFDFSGVPGFDLSRLQSLWHVKSRTYLYGRPVSRPLDLAEVDGVPVSPPATSGRVLKVKADTSGMSANDAVIAAYDLPAG